MAKATAKPASTVKSWKERGSIPDVHKPQVLRVAVSLGIDLRPEHFFPDYSSPTPTTAQPEADAA